jgi:hypothetical protein
MSMRVPGWLLIGGSIVAALLLILRVDYLHAVGRERAELAAVQHKINGGPEFEKLWKRLAAATYESGDNDPALMDLLRKCDITIQVKRAPASTPSTPAASPNTTSPMDPSANAPH